MTSRKLLAGMVLALVLCFSVVGMASARAVSASSPSTKTSFNVQPRTCTFSLSLSPINQSAHVYSSVSVNVTVHCPPSYFPIFLDWRDGSGQDRQNCGTVVFSCGDGDVFTFTHQYNKAGKFLVKAYDNDQTSITAYTNISVS